MTRPSRPLGVRCTLAECPTWRSGDGTLLWLDIPEARLHGYRLEDGVHTTWTLPEPASALALTTEGDLLLTPTFGFARWAFGADAWTVIADPERGTPNRFNDGAVDPAGRFWAATLNAEKAPTNALYRLERGARPVRVDDGLRAGNGIAWSPDGARLFVVDSGTRTILAYDFDARSGEAGARRPWATFEAEDGTPDGIAVDRDGHLWCAMYGAGRLLHLRPDGRVAQVLEVPARHPTSCAFVGPDLRTLAVTSAGPPHAPASGDHDGDVFLLEADTPGLPLPPYRA